MDTFGCRPPAAVSGLMAPVAIGCIRKTAGPGYPITPGDGLRFTMGGGLTIICTDGYGFRAVPGDLPG